MQNEHWIDDHQRLLEVNIYPEIDRESRIEFDGLSFYPSTYSSSLIANSKYPKDSYPKEHLSEVQSIWQYFYRKDPKEKWNPDGLIEQWSFKDVATANKAYAELEQIAVSAYFNTFPYYCISGNLIFIFHTRAMAFCYAQKTLFESFKSNLKKAAP